MGKVHVFKKIAGTLLSLCFLLPAGWSLASGVFEEAETQKEDWPHHLRLLTGPNGGQWSMLGEPISRALSADLIITSSRLGGGLSNIGSVNDRMADLGFTLTSFLGTARSGEPEYARIRTDNVTLLANIYPQVLYFLLRKDFAETHGIDSVETLLGKRMPLRFASLKPGTASEFILSMLLKYGYDTSFDALREQGWTIAFNNYAETADNFVDGKLDCFVYTAGTVVPLILTMEELTDVVILPLDQKVLDLLAEKFGTTTYVIPPDVYRSITQPVRTLGDYTSLVVRRDLPDDLVFAINRTLWENKQRIADIVADFGALSAETALPEDVEVHPGSLAFWKGLNKE